MSSIKNRLLHGRPLELWLASAVKKPSLWTDLCCLVQDNEKSFFKLSDEELLFSLEVISKARQDKTDAEVLLALFFTAAVLHRMEQQSPYRGKLLARKVLMRCFPRKALVHGLRRLFFGSPSKTENDRECAAWVDLLRTACDCFRDSRSVVDWMWQLWLLQQPRPNAQHPGTLRTDGQCFFLLEEPFLAWWHRRTVRTVPCQEIWAQMERRGWLHGGCRLVDPYACTQGRPYVPAWKLSEKSLAVIDRERKNGKWQEVCFAQLITLPLKNTSPAIVPSYVFLPLSDHSWVRLPARLSLFLMDALSGAIENLAHDPVRTAAFSYWAHDVGLLCLPLEVLPQLTKRHVRELLSAAAIYPNSTFGRWPAGIFARPLADGDAEPVLVLSLTRNPSVSPTLLTAALEFRLLQTLQDSFLADSAQLLGQGALARVDLPDCQEFFDSCRKIPAMMKRLQGIGDHRVVGTF